MVAFLEKNGLQHGEAAVRGEGRVRELGWSCDSKVLLVWRERGEGGSTIQLWTTSNYHWYLKATLEEEGEVVAPCWSSEDPTTLRYVVREEQEEVVVTVTLAWGTDTGGELSTVAVVDGSVVKLTPFREVVVPPPSSALELEVGEQVQEVAFPTPGEEGEQGVLATAAMEDNSLLVVTRGGLCVFEVGEGEEEAEGGGVKVTGAGGNGFTVRCSRWRLVARLACPAMAGLVGVAWVGSRLVAASRTSTEVVVLQQVEGEVVEVERLPVEARVWLVAGRAGGAVVQLEGGALLQVGWEGGEVSITPMESFPGTCDTMAVTEVGVVGVTTRHKLVLGDKEVGSGVTSMVVSPPHLVATTTDHRLLTRYLATLGGPGAWAEGGSRRVERGSRLVAVVPRHCRTVLQMPRGNLEVVQPRALAISMLAALLDARHYSQAYLLARRQRMNLNLLTDHDPAAFLAGLPELVAQLADKPEQVAVFVAELGEEDVCTTMYSDYYPSRGGDQPGKVARICRQVSCCWSLALTLPCSCERRWSGRTPVWGAWASSRCSPPS